jgi:hypothetical protein
MYNTYLNNSKVNVKLPLPLTKHQAMKAYPLPH